MKTVQCSSRIYLFSLIPFYSNRRLMKNILILLAQLVTVGHAVDVKGSGFRIGRAYDPRYESCCDVVPYSNADRHQFTRCCGGLQYDMTEQVCCNRTVYAFQSGFGCCGDTYFNLTAQYCCPAVDGHSQVKEVPDALLKGGIGKFLNCCCSEAYDTRTQLCCNCAIVTKTANNVSCCGTTAYIPSPGFECCNGSVVDFPDANYACCGNESYNTQKNFCCGTRNYEKTKHTYRSNYYYVNPKDSCCGNERYDSQQQLCCNGLNDGIQRVVTPPGSRYQYGCCGTDHYHTSSELCCEINGIKTVKKRQDYSHNACCGNVTFSSNSHICCDNNIMEKTEYNDNLCCGLYPYNNWTQLCCHDEEIRQQRSYRKQYGTECCGIVPYFPERETCVNKQVVPVTRSYRSCKGKRYNPDVDMCCGDSVVHKVEPNVTYACCGSYGYIIGNEICCYGLEVRPITHPGQTMCCVVEDDKRNDNTCCPCTNPMVPNNYGRPTRRPPIG